MEKPLVSVIIPTHNSSRYISAAMDSVVCQRMKSIEMICVDSSSDETKSILESYSRKDARVRIISDANGSYGHKINRGIDEARGDYVSILESDDMYSEDALEVLYEIAVKNDLDYAKGTYTNLLMINERNIEIYQRRYSNKNVRRIIDFSEEPYARIMSLNNIWTGLYKISFLKKNDIYLNESPGASYQDTGFSVLCAAYAKRIMYLEESVYYYRRDNEESSVKDQNKYRCIYDELQWIKAELESRGLLSEPIIAFYDQVKNATFLWNASRLDKYYCDQFLDLLDDELKDYIAKEICYKRSEEELFNAAIKKAYSAISNFDTISVFGAGRKAEDFLFFARLINPKVSLFLYDNDSSKWNKRISDIQIDNPLCMNNNVDIVLVTVDNKYYKSVYEQLVSMGIDSAKITSLAVFPEGAQLIKWIDRYV